MEIRDARNICFLGLGLMVIGFCSSVAFALDPMGPPAAGLGQGQFKPGIDYSYSTMDLKLIDGKWLELLNGEFYDAGEALSFTLKNFKMNKVYANLGYGILDNWDAFLRLGGANARFGDSIWEEGEKFDSDNEFTIGFGTRATFYEENNLKIGGLFQLSWAEFDGKLKAGHWLTADSVDIELTEIQIAVGPTYKLIDNVLIYGGPFFHLVSGKLEDRFSEMYEEGRLTSKYSWNIEEGSIFGGYIGSQIDIAENASLSIEFQHTAAADAIGLGLIWRF